MQTGEGDRILQNVKKRPKIPLSSPFLDASLWLPQRERTVIWAHTCFGCVGSFLAAKSQERLRQNKKGDLPILGQNHLLNQIQMGP